MDEIRSFFQKWTKQLERLPKWAWGSAVLMCIVLLAVIINPGHETTVSQAAVDPLQSPASLAVDIFLKFSVVLGLIYLAYYLLHRWQGNRLATGNRQLMMKETLHLSPRRSIHLVQAGNRTLLIGATDQAVSFLAEIDPHLTIQPSPQNASPVEFASLLASSQQLNKDKKNNRKNMKKISTIPWIYRILLVFVFVLLLAGCVGSPEMAAPGVTLTIDPAATSQPKQVSSGVQLLVLLTVLSVAPSILILATSFTRIVIVLSMLRTAIGTPSIPPNQVVIGLSMLLTFFIMAPVYNKVDQTALQPYIKGQISQETAFKSAMDPLREFMFKQTREKDIQLFLELSGKTQPETLEDIPTTTLLPAFVISELRTSFMMGFFIYVPFLVIDMVISSILLSMGMMMLPPSLISLPFKVLLFVLVDGWYLIVRSLALSFH